MKLKLKSWLKSHKLVAIGTVIGTLAVIVGIMVWTQLFAPSPVPPDIRSQLNFRVIYPRGHSIDANSWKYVSDQQSLSFNVKYNGYTAAYTEQKVPLAFRDDLAAYNRFIGGLRPVSNFNVGLGTVSLTNFVTAGDYQLVGLSGILNSKGTLLIVHPDHNLNDSQWQSLFGNLITGR